MQDQHCHILWDVDDGSATRDETLQMLDEAAKAGITSMICTPHLRWDDFDRAKVERHFAEFKELAQDRGIAASLGFEIYYKKLLKLGLHHAREYCMGETNRVLIEFNSGGEIPFGWEYTMDQLRNKHGLDVIIAHPERYSTVLQDFDSVYRLIDAGCAIQVSAPDLQGGFFNKRAKVAKRILKEGLCSALVSDAHHPEHYQIFEKMVRDLGKRF